MTTRYTGQCACGSVRLGFDTDPSFIAVCHCLDCKKASGGEAATFFAVPEGEFKRSGDVKSHHYVADSGHGLDRNFCPKVRSTAVHGQARGLSRARVRHARKPRPARADHAQRRDVRQAQAGVGEASGRAAVREHAELKSSYEGRRSRQYLRVVSGRR